MKKGLLFISCDEAKHICDKAQYDEASSWEKVKLNIRLSWCRITKAYYKRNTKLTEVLESAKTDSLHPEERKSMASKFQEELSKH
ncbi:hypothetical protein [Hyunsoonleella pacifica]|uniref:Glycine dehydrogenase n=1 Tax=Hyunsoonleella pacifica TaxID=1080224 RepID=A0A4Q9FMA9_9FLAO|nr:hypothetical protein [Hyunsoonleella pacifica]TBN12462.1 hypothetical protein EYD46_17235 [Hyunsoonleella pacifica]GGD29262.1 hypothetical protein GCM10011368_34100 [Hyunsoonleella pacifica]